MSDLKISDEGIAVYCALRSVMKRDRSYYGITENQIYYYLTGEASISKWNRKVVGFGLSSLLDRGIVSVAHELNSQDKILDLSLLHIDSESNKKFTTIELSEVQIILNGCGLNRYSILRYFIFLVGTFNPSISVYLYELDKKSRILSTMPIDYLCRLSGLSKSTILSYNKILEDLRLLYIYHAADYYHTDDKGIKSPSNVYSRYCDREYVNQYVKNDAQYRSYGKYESKSKSAANHKRRLSQRYNRLIAGSGDYSTEEIQEVYDYILSQNRYYLTRYEKSKFEPYREKIRDVSKLKELLAKKKNNT